MSARAPAAEDPEARLFFALLYGPMVQFARAPNAAEPSVVAMPPQLPLSVDIVFTHPPDTVLPGSLPHFAFCPVMKLHEPSELSFCLTESSGEELFGLSLQQLVPHPLATDAEDANGRVAQRHRPSALCVFSSRPILSGLSRLLRSLLPLAQQALRSPLERQGKELTIRAGRNEHGLGLVMSPTNTVMQVEAGSVAARERRLRPGDTVLSLDGTPLEGMRFADALREQQQRRAAEAEAQPASARPATPPSMERGSAHSLQIRRTYEVLTPHADGCSELRAALEKSFAALRKREGDLRWLVANPFWMAAPLEPLFRAMRWSTAEVVYLLCGVLTDQKVLIHSSDPAALLPAAQVRPPRDLARRHRTRRDLRRVPGASRAHLGRIRRRRSDRYLRRSRTRRCTSPTSHRPCFPSPTPPR